MKPASSAEPDPEWTEGIPRCRESCPHHDGKRCALMGVRPDRLCEPAVLELTADLSKERRVLKAIAEKIGYWKEEPYACGFPPALEVLRDIEALLNHRSTKEKPGA